MAPVAVKSRGADYTQDNKYFPTDLSCKRVCGLYTVRIIHGEAR